MVVYKVATENSDNIAGGIAGEMLKLNKNVGDYFVF